MQNYKELQKDSVSTQVNRKTFQIKLKNFYMSKEFYKFVFLAFLFPHRYDIYRSSYEHVYIV